MEKYQGWAGRDFVAASFEAGTGSPWDKDDPFVPDADFPTDEEIIVAMYAQGNYEGSAFVLFRRDGKLYEVHGSHCSCNGLEGQWAPEETTIEALRMQKPYDSDIAIALGEALAKLEE